MKVVQINAVNRYSSTGLNTLELHEFLKDHGHDSYVFCTNEEDPSQGVYRIGSPWDYKQHAFLSRLTGRQAQFSDGATRRLIRQLEQISPDIVHLGNLHANYINLPMLLTWLSNNDVATSLTLHDCWFFTGHCCHFIDTKCERWTVACGHCPDLHNWNRSWFFDRSAQNLELKRRLFTAIPRLAVIGVSDWVTDLARRSILKNTSIIRTIYNWIDTEKFCPQDTSDLRSRLGLEGKKVILGISQTWGPKKGIHDFFAISERLPECVVLMVGKIPEEYTAPSNVLSLPPTSSPLELTGYYSMADVFFMPSQRETFGKVTAEALSSGTPAVAYNATAIPEVVGPGCGAVVQSGDIDSAARELKQILHNGKDFYEATCREFAVSNFSKEKSLGQYLEVFEKLTANRS